MKIKMPRTTFGIPASWHPRSPHHKRLIEPLVTSLLVGLAAFACTDPEAGSTPGLSSGTGTAAPPLVRLASFTDGDVADWMHAPQVYERETVFEWRFETVQDLKPWKLHRTKFKPIPEGGGFFVRTTTDEPSWIQRDDLNLKAEDLDLIEVERRGGFDKLSMLWSTRDRPFDSKRAIYRRGVRDSGQDVVRQTFDVARSAEWQGPIERLRFNPARKDDTYQEILAIRGLRRSLHAERLAQALPLPYHQEFDKDSRLSLLAPPGFEHTRRLENLDGDAFLTLAMGLQQVAGPEVRFVVEVEPDGGARNRVFERILDPETDGEAWHPARVELGAFAGQDITVVLRTEGPSPDELLDGLPVWGLPEIKAPRTDVERLPNVVLIVADTLRPDRMSLYGHDRPTTPRLDAWAERRGVIFEQTIAAAPWTLPSHASMLTGLDPTRHGVNFAQPIPAHLDLLAQRLRRQGYSTLAYTGSGYMGPTFGWTRGFDRFVHTVGLTPENQRRREDIATYLPDLLESLPQTAGPYFLFVHTYEVHSPYFPRLEWLEKHAPDITAAAGLKLEEPFDLKGQGHDAHDGRRNRIDMVRGLTPDRRPFDMEDLDALHAVYDSGIAYMDDHVGRLLDHLQESGAERDALVLFTSDHGEALMEAPTGRPLAGHSYLYDFNLHIPLVVALPDGAGRRTDAGRRIDTQVRQVDITPTVLDVLGLDGGDLDGRSLLPFWKEAEGHAPRVAESYAASSNYGISLRLDRGFKYVLQHSIWAEPNDGGELFDLHGNPDENQNVASDHAELTESLDRELRRRLDSSICRLEAVLENPSSTPWTVALQGPSIGVRNLKSADPNCVDCASWDGRRTLLKVPAQSSLTVSWTGPFFGRTLVQSDPHKGGPSSLSFDDGQVAGGAPFVHDFNEGRGIRVERQGEGCPWDAPQAAPQDIDEETRKQLEALGYLTG